MADPRLDSGEHHVDAADRDAYPFTPDGFERFRNAALDQILRHQKVTILGEGIETTIDCTDR